MPTDDTLARRRPQVGIEFDLEGPVDLVPDYLRRVYSWAYLNPIGRAIFDHPVVVSAILWGNYRRLIETVQEEIVPGSKVLQTACVYGEFSVRLAETVGEAGSLDIIDVAPIQVEYCRAKLKDFRFARVICCDAVDPPPGPYDAVCCFFLLHEVPEDYKRRIVAAIFDRLRPGGKAVFVDYHGPHPVHPLRPIMRAVYRWLEPFAKVMWSRDIESYAPADPALTWTKQTYFGGLYQKTVAIKAP
ncbi:MAG: methyltransferase domain-containing protein [Azospirillum sp.]|nr:methyltransferase domain-containing protein [Azospirillum sp.]